jgi:hypothetical protein
MLRGVISKTPFDPIRLPEAGKPRADSNWTPAGAGETIILQLISGAVNASVMIFSPSLQRQGYLRALNFYLRNEGE